MNPHGTSVWIAPALDLVERGARGILVTVAQARGSTPREAGTKMLVWSDGIAGTVGGGHLEFKAIAHARAMICTAEFGTAHIQQFSLGPELAQCCGGSAALLFEPLSTDSASWLEEWADAETAESQRVVITKIGGGPDAKIFIDSGAALSDAPPTLPSASRGEGISHGRSVPPPLRRRVGWGVLQDGLIERAKALAAGRGRCANIELRDSGDVYLIEAIRPVRDHLYLFGAGHVGRAIVRAVEPLPFRITWIDSRAGAFPDGPPPHIVTLPSSAPPTEVDGAPTGAFYLVMTHSHPLDLDICARVLERGDFAYLGLIGSETKRARFASRLRAIGIPAPTLARLTCPIGIPGIDGKEPATIAASVAAQLLIVAGQRHQAAGRPVARIVGSGL
jgi:xanthine dehydrogenase accessory factor